MNGRRTTANKFHRYFEKFRDGTPGFRCGSPQTCQGSVQNVAGRTRRSAPKASKTANATSGTTSTTPPIRPQRSTNHRRDAPREQRGERPHDEERERDALRQPGSLGKVLRPSRALGAARVTRDARSQHGGRSRCSPSDVTSVSRARPPGRRSTCEADRSVGLDHAVAGLTPGRVELDPVAGTEVGEMPERSAPHDAGPHHDDVATAAGIRRPADVAGTAVEIVTTRALDERRCRSRRPFDTSRATAWPGAGARVDDVADELASEIAPGIGQPANRSTRRRRRRTTRR